MGVLGAQPWRYSIWFALLLLTLSVCRQSSAAARSKGGHDELDLLGGLGMKLLQSVPPQWKTLTQLRGGPSAVQHPAVAGSGIPGTGNIVLSNSKTDNYS